jgi:hypothetical protein
MTPMVKIALYGLRVYLIVLLLLILVKFIRDYARPETSHEEPAATQKAQRE